MGDLVIYKREKQRMNARVGKREREAFSLTFRERNCDFHRERERRGGREEEEKEKKVSSVGGKLLLHETPQLSSLFYFFGVK